MTGSRQKFSEIMTRIFVYTCALLLLVIFASLIEPVITQGTFSLSVNWFTTNPELSGKSGGIFSVLVSTLLILLISLLAAVPIGLGSAIFLAEYNTRKHPKLTRYIRLALDLLASTPSIIIGLFGYLFFSIYLTLGFSILAGGLSLACMILPFIVSYTEHSLRSLPENLRRNCLTLNLSKSRSILLILLPVAMPGIITGIILAIGRALAETAVLIFTAGYVDRTPTSVLDSGRALSVHIYDLSMNVPGGSDNAYTTALTLITLIFLINGIVILSGKRLATT